MNNMETKFENFEDDLDDDEYSTCESCGGDSMWERCWECGGEGGHGYEDDLQFEDPLWYSPGDFITCDICEGKGGYHVCVSKCGGKNNLLNKADVSSST